MSASLPDSAVTSLAEYVRRTGNGRRLLAHLTGVSQAQSLLAGYDAPPYVACRHEGSVRQWCTSELRHVRNCDLHETCTRGPNNGKVASCQTCADYAPESWPESNATAEWPIKFDERNLWPHLSGKRFNPSIIEHEDGYLFAARTGWKGSEIVVGRMDRQFRSVGPPAQLQLWHQQANYGREDPRLFRFRGRLHVAYIGVVGVNRLRHTNQLYARLSENGMRVEQIFHLRVPGRTSWLKNINFFDYQSELFAIYTIAPHVILKVDGEYAHRVYETPTPAPWQPGTEMRGGASPVLIGDEWYHFFHSRYEAPRRYMAGLYCFENRPPFAVTRIIPEPLLTARTADQPHGQYCPVVFPCGAVVTHEQQIVVSCGVHDRWSELYLFNPDELSARLQRIGGTP